VARLGQVAFAARRAAHRADVAGGVRAERARAVALIDGTGIAVVGARGPRRLSRVGGTRRARAVARVGEIALPRRRATHPASVAGRMLAGVRRPVAAIEGAEAAVVGAAGAHDRFHVGGARGARAVAGLSDVAHAGGRAADDARVARRMLASDRAPVAAV